MSVTMAFDYLGSLRCRVAHEPSGALIETDAPLDNMGRGEAFSPTDLVAVALATCAVTTMAIRAQKEGVAFEGARGRVVKEMVSNPTRRVGKLAVEIVMPVGVEAAHRPWFELIARTCPVALSLSTEVEAEIRFVYPDDPRTSMPR